MTTDEHDSTRAAPEKEAACLSPNVAVLGIVSLLMGMSSAMIYGLLPVFLVTSLGASTTTVGLIEGTAEATMSAVKIFSGVASDWIGRRKPLVVLGYTLSAVNKLLFPLAESASIVLIARIADRIGKGVRDAPRRAACRRDTLGNSRVGFRPAVRALHRRGSRRSDRGHYSDDAQRRQFQAGVLDCAVARVCIDRGVAHRRQGAAEPVCGRPKLVIDPTQ